MSNSRSLISINLGDLSKPATTLIEKISNAIGLVYEPTHIRRIAKANVESRKIESLGAHDINEIQDRAVSRLIYEETKKQRNIESITQKAIPNISDNSKPENIEDDWISYFFEKCRSISDPEMQSLWSRILSGESNRPKSYSKRTIDLVSSLEKEEAHLFTSLCSFSVESGPIRIPLILDHNAEIYTVRGIRFRSLQHLESIGFINLHSGPGDFVLRNPRNNRMFIVRYYDFLVRLTVNEGSNELKIGCVTLTESGAQLSPICGSQKNEEFQQYMIEYYKKECLKVEVLEGG